MMDYAVIMAGGTGKRLWPLSRRKRPKQVLRLLEGKTLLGSCFDRLRPIFDPERIWVLTNVDYADLVRQDLPELPADHVVAEPLVRDTCGAIGLAAAILIRHDPDATMAVMTADQMVRPPEVLQGAIQEALCFVHAHPRSLVTFGIKPTFASTQLGYIKLGCAKASDGGASPVYPVEAFKEKPDAATAQVYLESGLYSWNSGMFVWKAQTIQDYILRFLPQAREPIEKIGQAWGTRHQEAALQEWFPRLPQISIDFAVMEKASDVFAIKLDCQWLDMGSFMALGQLIGPDADHNVVAAKTRELLDCRDTIVVTEDDGHLIAAIGMEGVIIAHSPEATLVCPIEKADRLKELLERMERQGATKYL
jgi:mannose-1-phosphate guanylyltransferase